MATTKNLPMNLLDVSLIEADFQNNIFRFQVMDNQDIPRMTTFTCDPSTRAVYFSGTKASQLRGVHNELDLIAQVNPEVQKLLDATLKESGLATE